MAEPVYEMKHVETEEIIQVSKSQIPDKMLEGYELTSNKPVEE